MDRKLLLPYKPIPVLITLLFATLSTFGVKPTSIPSPTFSPPITAVQQQPVKYATTAKSRKHYYKNVKDERVQSPTHSTTIPAGACAGMALIVSAEITEAPCSHYGRVKKWLN